MRIRSYFATALVSGVGLVSTPGFAQQVDEIVVTAQKRSENLQDVPIAVSAVTEGGLTAAGVNRVEDLSVTVPGFSLTKQGAATQLYIRGVGSTGGSAGQESAIATFVDGVYMPAQTGATFGFNNVERVEVLKGPQGTLYGRNATGGALNIITKSPTADFGMDAEIAIGNKETMEGNFYITGGLAEGVSANFGATYRDQGEGFGTNLASGRDINKIRDYGVRGKLLLEPSYDTRITLSADYGRTVGSTGVAYRNYSATSREFFTGVAGWPYGFWDITSDIDPKYETTIKGVSGRIEQQLGGAILTSITAYRTSKTRQTFDVDETAAPLFNSDLSEDNKQFTQELQLASDTAGPLSWIAGLFYLNGSAAYEPWRIEGELFGRDPANGFRSQSVFSKQKTTSYAAFGQATYEIADGTNITGGLRYTIDKRGQEASGFLTLLNDAQVPLFPDIDRTKTFKKLTWRLAADHEIAPDVMLYASYNRGFLSGVYNMSGVATAAPPVDPETLDAYEMGVKSTLLDRRVRLNIAGFYYKYKNLQLSRIQDGTLVLVNAARAKMYGIDLDFSAVLTDFLSLSGGGQYVHNRYEDFPGAPFTETNNSFPFGNILTAQNARGNRLNRTPDFSFTVTADVHFPVADGELNTSATYSYNDGFFWEPDNDLQQSAYGLLSGQVKWTAPSTEWYVRAYARNLLNKEYFIQGASSELGNLGSAGPGRLFGVGIGVTF